MCETHCKTFIFKQIIYLSVTSCAAQVVKFSACFLKFRCKFLSVSILSIFLVVIITIWLNGHPSQ